ncbi:MAG: lyase family protein [Sulfolobales archaeon]
MLRYTERAVKVFLNTGTRFPRKVIWAMGLIKYSAARANTELGLLDKIMGEAISKASLELAEGLHDDKVIVDVFQTGSATGLNMNINEVIALRASELCNCEVHPNDHVNLCQSTNDVVTSAIRIAALADIRESLEPSLNEFMNSLKELIIKTENVAKPGRTHLRDALPITMALEFKAFLDALKHDLEIMNSVKEYIMELPLGGTAVGTGINSHPDFPQLVIKSLRELTKIDLRLSDVKTRGMRLLSDLVMLSSSLRVLALDIMRLCQDLRLMYSGPETGLNEIDIPQEVPGSSIMPGKENPVTVEAAMLAATQVMGLDYSNNLVGMLGEFELSMGIPLITFNIHTQISLLSEAMRKLSQHVLRRIEPNIKRSRELAERSQALITILTPLVGYDKATLLTKKLKEGKKLIDVLKELGLSDDVISEFKDLNKLLKPGMLVKKSH